MRPCASWRHAVLSNETHAVATAAARAIAERHRDWLAAHPERRQAAWEDLDDADRDPAAVGSPGWVRVQGVHLLRYTLRRTDHHALDEAPTFSLHHLLCDAEKGTHATAADLEDLAAFVVPYVDLRGVMHGFHKYQLQQRVNPVGRGATNAANTLPSTRRAAGAFGDEEVPVAPRSAAGPPPLRMRLDSSIVLSMASECARCDIDNSWFVFGYATIGPAGPTSDNDDAAHLILDRAQTRLCRDWFRRFRTPLPHPTLIESADLLDSINRVSLYVDDASVSEGMRRTREQHAARLTAQVSEDLAAQHPDDTPVERAARVRRAVDARTGYHPVDDLWHRPGGLPDASWGAELLWSVECVSGERPDAAEAAGRALGAPASDAAHLTPGWLRAPYPREWCPPAKREERSTPQYYPARNALCFHVPAVPPPVWEAPGFAAEAGGDPQQRLNPYDATSARAMLNAWAVFESAQQRAVAAETRLTADEHGFAGVGRHPAMLPEDALLGDPAGAPDPRNRLAFRVTMDGLGWVGEGTTSHERRPDWYLGDGGELALDRVGAVVG